MILEPTPEAMMPVPPELELKRRYYMIDPWETARLSEDYDEARPLINTALSPFDELDFN